MFTPHTIENLQERLENLIAEFNDPKMNDDNQANISWEILEALTRGDTSSNLNYPIIKDYVSTETLLKAFKISASMLNKWLEPQNPKGSEHDDPFCDMTGELLRSSCPEVAETDEYKKLVENADRLAGIPENTLLRGNLKTVKNGNHLMHLPSLLESFAIATEGRVEATHFSAVSLKLGNEFKGCVLIRPVNAQPVLVVDNECMPYNDHMPQLVKALTLGE